MPDNRRFLLLQVRDADDPIRQQEVGCFAEALGCDLSQITPHDLLAGAPSRAEIDRHDIVLLGGSGDYSVAVGGPWLEGALDAMRLLHDISKPTFASCWGFQAFCRAMGGECVHDLANAELGQVQLTLTDAGCDDPLFGSLPEPLLAHAGHEDRVTTLPADAVLLASTSRVAQQAIRFADKPIYATQFHPELTAEKFLERVEAYPKYVEQIAGIPFAEFRQGCVETPAANELLRRFTDRALG